MKRIVIMGASSGLGRIIAGNYAKTGWKVGVAARNKTALMQLKELYGDNIEWECIDVTSDDAPERLHELISRLGGMDIYFHVSGICIENPELDIADDIMTVETNVAGFTRMIDAAVNYFRTTGKEGQVAAITSVAGTKGIADLASYSAAKRYQWTYFQAVEQLVHREKLPIIFTEIRPGWTRTPLIDPNRKYLMAMDAEKVAALSFKAILRKRRVAVIDYRWRVMSFLWRLLPYRAWIRIPIYASKASAQASDQSEL